MLVHGRRRGSCGGPGQPVRQALINVKTLPKAELACQALGQAPGQAPRQAPGQAHRPPVPAKVRHAPPEWWGGDVRPCRGGQRSAAPARAPLGYVAISAQGSIVDSGIGLQSPCSGTHQRGRIAGFSCKSSRRLRRLLIEWEGNRPGYALKGLSLTVPGPCVTPSEWRRLFHVFATRCGRLGVIVIWRVELQKRKQPHVHAVVWEPESRAGAWYAWHDVLRGTGAVEVADREGNRRVVESRDHVPGATEHAAKVDHLNERDPMGWYRYLACHASKKKQAQLGWEGRQWGVIGRKLLQRSAVEKHELSPSETVRVNRILRKLIGMKTVSRHGSMLWFVKPETVRRTLVWAKGFSVEESKAQT